MAGGVGSDGHGNFCVGGGSLVSHWVAVGQYLEDVLANRRPALSLPPPRVTPSRSCRGRVRGGPAAALDACFAVRRRPTVGSRWPLPGRRAGPEGCLEGGGRTGAVVGLWEAPLTGAGRARGVADERSWER